MLPSFALSLVCTWALLSSALAFVVPAARPIAVSNLVNSRIARKPAQLAVGLQMDAEPGHHEVLLSRSRFARRTMACKLYSRMANRLSGQTLSQSMGVQEAAEESLLHGMKTAQISSETVAGLDLKADVEGARIKTTNATASNRRTKTANKVSQSKAKDAANAPKDQQLAVAFGAFADCLLRTKGRVRFNIINTAFRHEFPTLAAEDKVANSTLGRRISAWYLEKTGTPLKRTSQGVLQNLSLVNPSYTPTDLRSLRAAQMLFEPEMRKKFDSLGLSPLQGLEKGAGNKGDAGASNVKAEPKKVRSPSEKRVQVIKNADGRVIRVVRNADESKGSKGKVLFDLGQSVRRKVDLAASRRPGSRSDAPVVSGSSRGSKLDDLSQAVQICIESFANTMLLPEGNATFQQVSAAFRQEFALLRSQERCADALLGKRLYEWYMAKYGVALTRRKSKEALSISRSAIPYTNLGLRDAAHAQGVDTVQLNQAKVALRKALQMEGVGMMVRRVGQDFTVFTIVPGSPAALNGRIQMGDVLVAVDGREVRGMATQELADLVLGPRGSVVRLSLRRQEQRGGEPQSFEVLLKRNDLAVEPSDIANVETADLARRALTTAGES